MARTDFKLIGKGLYSPTEASILTQVPIRRVNRWTRGYWYVDRGRVRWSKPIVGDGKRKVGDAPFLTFADIIEVRALSAFRDEGVGWQTIRAASDRARKDLQTSHPFSSYRFETDGRRILREVTDDTGDKHLIDIVSDQLEFRRLVMDFLRQGLKYDGHDAPQSWAPLGEDRTVVVSPSHSFGAPIVVPSGVQTRVLYGSFKAEGSYEDVARWYKVSPDAVRDAVEFEEGLRKAA